jgi:hypothetical protein
MKRSLVALSLAALATAGCVTVPGPADYFKFDGMQPAHPELEYGGGRRQYAGSWQQDNTIRIQLS